MSVRRCRRVISLHIRRGRRIYNHVRQPPETTGFTKTTEWVAWIVSTGLLVPVAGVTSRRCAHCYGAPGSNTDFSTCYKCAIGIPVDPWVQGVIPISYSLEARLESAIYSYKDGGERWLSLPFGSLLYEFLRRHYRHIMDTFGAVDAIVPIPPHPDQVRAFNHLELIVASVTDFGNAFPWEFGLLANIKPGSNKTRSLETDRFEVAAGRDVKGQTVIVFDDTFTSGSSLASAGYTLRAAGASTVVALTLGRQINPKKYVTAVPIVEEQVGRPFDIDRCVLDQ